MIKTRIRICFQLNIVNIEILWLVLLDVVLLACRC